MTTTSLFAESDVFRRVASDVFRAESDSFLVQSRRRSDVFRAESFYVIRRICHPNHAGMVGQE